MKRSTLKTPKPKTIGPNPDSWANDFVVVEPANPQKRPLPPQVKLKGKKGSLEYVKEQRR
ncbi:hypothetical protein [Meiothermus ruber]|uniref:hypothetical protein n=1 Tax=Meiothermus ruber TaxID=277 RepID=UPI0012FB92E5|nr:hypothetical protein [Meiothermus ruber]